MKLIKILVVMLVSYGTSYGSPIVIKPSQVNTIQAVIDSATSDIHIVLEEGVYTLNGRIFLENKSSITITGVPYKTIIDGINILNTEIDQESNKPTTWGGLIDIEKSEDITIRGLYIRNSNFAGIFVHNKSNDITIEDNYTENTYTSGIGVWESQNIFIYGNEVANACDGGEQESITISESSEVEVIGNEVHHNGYTELDGNHFGGEGIDIKEGSFEVMVSHNYVHDITSRVGIYIDAWDKDSHSITIRNNVVVNNGHSGIVVASECGGNIDNIVISHNEVMNNAYSGIHIAGYSNPDECANSTSVMSNFYLENNTIEGNGYGIFDDANNIQEGGAFNISNPNIYNIHIAYNTFSDNVTKYIEALAYNGISKVDSQISTWGVESQIEPSDALKFYIYDNDASN